MELTADAIEAVVGAALAEDVGAGDLTTEAVVPAEVRTRAELFVEEPGVVCGVGASALVFKTLDPEVEVLPLVEDGARIDGPTPVARIEGPARAILTGGGYAEF